MLRKGFSFDWSPYSPVRTLIRTLCVCAWNFPLCVFLAPGETDVPLLTALLSVRPLWRMAVQQTCVAWTIQLALRQSLKDPIVRGLSNYGNLINLFSSSPLTAFVSAWDLLRDLCELHPIVGVRDEDSDTALFSRNQLHFEEALKLKLDHLWLRGSALGSFVISGLSCLNLPPTKSVILILTRWNQSSPWPIKAGSTRDCVVVSYKRSNSGELKHYLGRKLGGRGLLCRFTAPLRLRSPSLFPTLLFSLPRGTKQTRMQQPFWDSMLLNCADCEETACKQEHCGSI